MDLKLPFGLKNGQIVQVADVESGLKCGCKCPACNHPLVAKKGSSNIHHFAHHKKAQCAYASETGIHLAAKKVIEEVGYILLPKLKAWIINTRETLLFDQIKLHFDKIDLEKRHHDIIPDILLEKAGHKLCIEICVTHAVDDQKRKKIIERKLSTIEIDLSKFDRSFDLGSLKEMVVNSVENKKWIFNLKRHNFHASILKSSIARNIITRGFANHIDYCPIPARVWKGKPYANFTDDCVGCKYLVISKNMYRDDIGPVYSAPMDHNDQGEIIYCIGHKTENDIANLLGGKSGEQFNQQNTVENTVMNLNIPFCPKCGKEMVLRTARKGPSLGSKFWGCSNYPACKGTL